MHHTSFYYLAGSIGNGGSIAKILELFCRYFRNFVGTNAGRLTCTDKTQN